MTVQPRAHLIAGVGLLVAVLGILGIGPRPAAASQAFSDLNTTGATLEVNAKGEALVTYTRSTGVPRHVLVWGAVNALAPTSGLPQVRFHFDYAGGWGRYRKPSYWRTFRNRCRPYTGPALPYLVAACDAPDGSYWALQSWQRRLPVLGFSPFTPRQSAYELHISHWTGELAQLAVGVHWTYDNSAIGIFGRLTYDGQPVYGFGATPKGVPKDRYSRTVYIDTFNSVYGAGWHRETGILLHHPGGTFCHSFVPQTPPPGYPSRATVPAAPGDRYRVSVMGPGVTPVVEWDGDGLLPWSGTEAEKRTQSAADDSWNGLMKGDSQCAPEAG